MKPRSGGIRGNLSRIPLPLHPGYLLVSTMIARWYGETMVKERPALTVEQWLASVPAERKDAINVVRDVINEHLPRG